MVGHHCADEGWRLRRHRPPAVGAARRSARPWSARVSCSPTSGCGGQTSTGSPSTSPMATSGGWRSPGPWPVEPRLLLLDEPTAGMNPQESATLAAFMRQIRDDLKLTILLIEHDMKVVMGVSERVTVLNYGEQDRRGHARRGPREPRRDRGLPREGRLMALLEVSRPARALRRHRGAQGHLADRRRGRGGHADRVQRGRQVHHAALASPGLPRPAQARIAFDGEDITGVPPHEIVTRGIAHVARGPALLLRG